MLGGFRKGSAKRVQKMEVAGSGVLELQGFRGLGSSRV